jgi:hypothetical protein
MVADLGKANLERIDRRLPTVVEAQKRGGIHFI